jgi:hypothetical protein
MRGCECVLGVKESVYSSNCNIYARHAFNSKKLQSRLEAKKSLVYVCVVGVCCIVLEYVAEERRENQTIKEHTHTLLHSRQISFEKLTRILWNNSYLKIKMNYRFSANPACIIFPALKLNHPERLKTV